MMSILDKFKDVNKEHELNKYFILSTFLVSKLDKSIYDNEPQP